LTGAAADLSSTMRPYLAALSAAGLLASCSTLPVPGRTEAIAGDAAAVLRASARAQGDAWRRYDRVDVAYDGEWSAIATRLQPVLTDPGFRKSSRETYQPPLSRVVQRHTGPEGVKEVTRQRPRTLVSYNGRPSDGSETRDAAALVADAYTAFLFGSSWLAEHGRGLGLLEEATLDGERCQRVAGLLTPGFGAADEDHFIAWIGADSRLLRRLQFSLNGLDSTRGADVDVVFSGHFRAADGSWWPGRFVEHIQRPLRAKAHEWTMTSLTIDGRKSK
jgi:hypothetical protein